MLSGTHGGCYLSGWFGIGIGMGGILGMIVGTGMVEWWNGGFAGMRAGMSASM